MLLTKSLNALNGDNNKKITPHQNSLAVDRCDLSKISFRRSNKTFDGTPWSSALDGAMEGSRSAVTASGELLEAPKVAAEVPRNTKNWCVSGGATKLAPRIPDR